MVPPLQEEKPPPPPPPMFPCMLLIMIDFGVVRIGSHVPERSLVTVAVRSVIERFSVAYVVFLLFPLLLFCVRSSNVIINFCLRFFLFVHYIIFILYIVYCFWCSVVSDSSAFSPSVLLFLFPFWFPFFLCFCFLFVPAPSFSSSSFPFPIFLPPLFASPMFVFLFPRFFLSFLLSLLLLCHFFWLPPTALPLSTVCVLCPPSGVYALSGLYLVEFVLLIQSSGCFRLFLRHLVLASLHWKGLVGVRSYRSACRLAFSIAFPCHLGGLGLLLWLSCLSLVVVFCAPSSFFPLWVSFTFLLFVGFHCLSSASLLSVVIPFGSPEVSFVLFGLCSGLLRFLYSPLPFLSLQLGSPAAVPGFRFPFLVILYLLRVRQRLVVAVDFLCFLSGFFLLSLLLRASRLRSPEVFFCLSVFLFCRIVCHYSRLSRCWFCPSAHFLCFLPPYPLLSHS